VRPTQGLAVDVFLENALAQHQPEIAPRAATALVLDNSSPKKHLSASWMRHARCGIIVAGNDQMSDPGPNNQYCGETPTCAFSAIEESLTTISARGAIS
jgi:hypothetical protein